MFTYFIPLTTTYSRAQVGYTCTHPVILTYNCHVLLSQRYPSSHNLFKSTGRYTSTHPVEMAGTPALQEVGVSGHGDVEGVHDVHSLLLGVGQNVLVVPQQFLLLPLKNTRSPPCNMSEMKVYPGLLYLLKNTQSPPCV